MIFIVQKNFMVHNSLWIVRVGSREEKNTHRPGKKIQWVRTLCPKNCPQPITLASRVKALRIYHLCINPLLLPKFACCSLIETNFVAGFTRVTFQSLQKIVLKIMCYVYCVTSVISKFGSRSVFHKTCE